MSSRWMGWFWDRSPVLLRPPRRLKRSLSILLYRWRSARRPMPPRVVTEPPLPAKAAATPRIQHPAIAVHVPQPPSPVEASPRGCPDTVRHFLEFQTETSITTSDTDLADTATFTVTLTASPDTDLPPTWLESQLFAAVAEDLDWTVAGWATPTPGSSGPASEIRGLGPASALVRLPREERRHRPMVLGRAVPHITGPPQKAEGPECSPKGDPRAARGFTPATATVRQVGPHFLRDDIGPGRVLRGRATSIHHALGDLPVVPGPRTALFLLPFLAVGGAERLLFDLLQGLKERYRCLVVTLDPHRHELGQTVDACRALTPWVYTLGDWLPREAQRDALRHLIRRYQVETLVSWNGTVTFFEEAATWRRELPRLRLVNQLFNHEGGWIEHYGPRLVENVDLHIAVNGPIGRALADERGVPEQRLAVIHHGVDVPPEVTARERSERQQRARRRLGLPEDALIIGSFMRLHVQKRPLDIVRLARRLASKQVGGRPIYFLLAGGGPLGAEVDGEIAVRPPGNLTRLPLQSNVEPLFDAVDLCLMTSAYEGLPVFLLEGLARSRPCVATAVGDIPFMLEGGGGRAIEQVGDLDAFEAAILELGAGPETLEAEGRRGRANIEERFGLERYARDYEKAIFPREHRP